MVKTYTVFERKRGRSSPTSRPTKDEDLKKTITGMKKGRFRYLTPEEYEYEKHHGRRAKFTTGKRTKQYERHRVKELRKRTDMDRILFYKDDDGSGKPYIRILNAKAELVGKYDDEYGLRLYDKNYSMKYAFDNPYYNFIDKEHVEKRLNAYLKRHPLHGYSQVRKFNGVPFEFLKLYDNEREAYEEQKDLRKSWDIGSRMKWRRDGLALYVNKLEFDYHNHPDPAIFSQNEMSRIRKKSKRFFENVV